MQSFPLVCAGNPSEQPCSLPSWRFQSLGLRFSSSGSKARPSCKVPPPAHWTNRLRSDPASRAAGPPPRTARGRSCPHGLGRQFHSQKFTRNLLPQPWALTRSHPLLSSHLSQNHPCPPQRGTQLLQDPPAPLWAGPGLRPLPSLGCSASLIPAPAVSCGTAARSTGLTPRQDPIAVSSAPHLDPWQETQAHHGVVPSPGSPLDVRSSLLPPPSHCHGAGITPPPLLGTRPWTPRVDRRAGAEHRC